MGTDSVPILEYRNSISELMHLTRARRINNPIRDAIFLVFSE
jgi:hypothetical protein